MCREDLPNCDRVYTERKVYICVRLGCVEVVLTVMVITSSKGGGVVVACMTISISFHLGWDCDAG